MAMLQRLIAQEKSKPSPPPPAASPPRHPADSIQHHEQTMIKGVLDEVGTMYAEAAHRPEIYTICLPNTVSAMNESSISSLSEAVYSSSCWCQQRGECGAAVKDEEEKTAAVDVPRVLLVFVNMSLDIQSRSALSTVFESTMDATDNIPRKLRKRILAGMVGPVDVFPPCDSHHGPPPSDAFRICAMQHWAYHGRLFPALAALTKRVTQTQDPVSSTLDEKDAKKKLKRKKSHHGEHNESGDEAVSKKKSKKTA